MTCECCCWNPIARGSTSEAAAAAIGRTRSGTECFTLAIEVLSPNDESRDKFGFYAARGVAEVWLVEPNTRALEVYVLRGSQYFISLPDANHVVHAPALDLQLAVVAGPKLRVTWAGGSAEL